MSFRRTIAISLWTLVLQSCAASLYVPTAEHVSKNETLEDLQAGRQIYTEHCSSCHYLYAPERFSEETWIKNLDSMQVRAKIKNEEKALVLKYLVAGRRYSSRR